MRGVKAKSARKTLRIRARHDERVTYLPEVSYVEGTRVTKEGKTVRTGARVLGKCKRKLYLNLKKGLGAKA